MMPTPRDLDALYVNANAFWKPVLQLNVGPGILECVALHWVNVHHGIRAPSASPSKDSGVNHQRFIHYLLREGRQLGRDDKKVRLTGHTPLSHMGEVEISRHGLRRGGRKQRVEAPLLKKVLRQPGHAGPGL